jgi:hypothetical protein
VGKLKIVGWLNEQTGSVVDMQGSNVSTYVIDFFTGFVG